MHKNILKIQLFSSSAVCLLCYVALLLGPNLGDSLFLITSESNSTNIVFYFFSSILFGIDFFLGPWVLLPFVIFTLEYAFVFSKREYTPDFFNGAALALGSFLFCATVFPDLIGTGLAYLLNQYIPTFLQYILLVISCATHVILLTQGSFKETVLNFFNNLKSNKDKRTVTTSDSSTSKFSLSSKLDGAMMKIGQKLKKSQKVEVTEQPRVAEAVAEPVEQETSKPTGFFANDEVKIEEKSKRKKVFPSLMERRKNISAEDAPYDLQEFIECISGGKESRKVISPDESYFDETVERLEEKLAEFNVDSKIIHIMKGPVVDTFELELGAGVKVSKITSISEDLSLALCGVPIRIIYPMQGKSTVGIEIPRSPRETIYLDDVLSARSFKNSQHKLPVAMGKNAFGETFVVDLAAMPHMLVAGETGAGKSVFVNTLLVSLLVMNSPRKLKLILIDPKQLEMALYAKLPHLVMPVVSDNPKLASVALLWACQEMERRYSILKTAGVRNIEGFNQKLPTLSDEELAKLTPFYEDVDDEGYELPYLVVVVDELADLMYSSSGKNIETNICRLAAKARASGIHLVLATQRPSVDVITGLIKANFPTRVSFRVTASVDSRTILNATGAEKLLGKGDMLFKQGVEMRRLHSSFVDEVAIEKLVTKISEGGQNFLSSAIDFLENEGEVTQEEEVVSGMPAITTSNQDDPLFKDAIRVVMEYRQASASMLQRRLKIGYNRAARLVEQMEEKGIVGPQQGSKPRKILIGGESSNSPHL